MARYRNQRQKRPLMSEMNVVPYIDVMLVLLVIFMITAPLLTTGVEVDLPNADAEAVTPENQSTPLVLSINAAGEWFINTGDQKDIAVDQEAALKFSTEALQDDPDRGVMVRADQSIEYGEVMEAMVTLQAAGAEKVSLMSEPAS
jgi:biopolymer transport protein TolR